MTVRSASDAAVIALSICQRCAAAAWQRQCRLLRKCRLPVQRTLPAGLATAPPAHHTASRCRCRFNYLGAVLCPLVSKHCFLLSTSHRLRASTIRSHATTKALSAILQKSVREGQMTVAGIDLEGCSVAGLDTCIMLPRW